jgi:hypothetical protein
MLLLLLLLALLLHRACWLLLLPRCQVVSLQVRHTVWLLLPWQLVFLLSSSSCGSIGHC